MISVVSSTTTSVLSIHTCEAQEELTISFKNC
jgi:hypothetical protein